MPSVSTFYLGPPRSSVFQPKSCSLAGIKLAPPIQDAAVVGVERRLDEKIWFIIKVTPQQTFTASGVLVPTDSTGARTRRPYYIARRYGDFTQFAQRLRHVVQPTERLSLHLLSYLWRSVTHESTGVAVPKIKGRFLLLPSKETLARRQQDLHHFVQAVLQLPVHVQQSTLVLEFFGCQKADTERQIRLESMWNQPQLAEAWPHHESTGRKRLRPRSRTSPHLNGSSACLPTLAKHVSHPNLSAVTHSDNANSNRSSLLPPWKRQRDSSHSKSHATSDSVHPLPHTVPAPSPSPASAYSSELHSSVSLPPPQTLPSINTVLRLPRQKSLSHLDICGSDGANDTTSSFFLDSSIASQLSPSPGPESPYEPDTIKIKVVYNVDNIIVIQVPRAIPFDQLRSRITQKFCDPATGVHLCLPPHFTLLYNDARSSASSTYGHPIAGKAVYISDEAEFRHVMQVEWGCLRKVTLRCIVPETESDRS